MVRSPSLPSLHRLQAKGFQVEFWGRAKAILGVDFSQAVRELEDILLELSIPIEEIIASGGGEAKGTQRLRCALNAKGWVKTKFEITKVINGRQRESISHEVDHVKSLNDDAVIALEIEWNNKDPFFDRFVIAPPSPLRRRGCQASDCFNAANPCSTVNGGA